VIDREWPALATAFSRWLDGSNFDREGRQRVSLSALTRQALHRAPDGLGDTDVLASSARRSALPP